MTAMIRRRTSFVLAMALLSLTACSLFRKDPAGPAGPAKPAGGVITVGVAASGPLDPALATGGSLLVIRTACDGLTSLDYETGEARPALATWAVAEGGKKIRITLSSGIKFHDGALVDAKAIAANLSRITKPENQSPWASLLAPVSGVAVTGEATLEISLTAAFADFPAVLAHPGLVPISPSELSKEPDQPVEPVCAGPYRIQTVEGGFRLTKIKNPAEQIVVRTFETAGEALDAFKRGEVQAAPLPSPRASEAPSQGHLRRTTAEVAYLAFDPAKPETSNPKFRQAVSLALDRFAIIDAAFGDGRQAMIRWLSTEPAAAGSPCSLYGRRRSSDPDRARQLFAESAAPAGLQVPLYLDSSKTGRLVAQAIRVQVKDALGVDLNPQALEPAAYQQSLRDRPAAAAWIASAAPDIPLARLLLDSLFAPGGRNNLFGFSDAAFDDPATKAKAPASSEVRDRLYEQAEGAVCEKMPSVPLWTGVSHWVFDPAKVAAPGAEPIDVFGDLILRRLSLLRSAGSKNRDDRLPAISNT